MPFLGLLLVVVAAGAAVWWWRMKMMKEAGSEIIDSVERMRGAYRRGRFSTVAEAAPLDSIQNPAIAAAVFFLVLANEKPMQKDEAKEIVRERMRDIIALRDMDEVLLFADWSAKSVVNLDDAVRQFRDLWLNSLDDGERRQLIDIGQQVAEVGGEPTPKQTDALQTLKRAMLN